MIEIVLRILIKDKKVIHEENLTMKINLINKNIKRDLAKGIKGFEVVHFYETSFFSNGHQ